eukprot:TRINITY_DN1002_c1_g1_i3.p1 TRINITY_DN1002_c1_g1~~TRINITY_DN1002_c1_g1_i3.p1  ORF type:complete len:544 (-),score=103.73 TRINITY_DN1002_c1_g1_i3:1265-2863(-)
MLGTFDVSCLTRCQASPFLKLSRKNSPSVRFCQLHKYCSKLAQKQKHTHICFADRVDGSFDGEEDEQGYIDIGGGGSESRDNIFEDGSVHPVEDESSEMDKFLNQDSREVGDFWQHVDPSLFGDEIARSIIPENPSPAPTDVTSYAFPPTQSGTNEDLIKQVQPTFDDIQEEQEIEEEEENIEDKQTYSFEDMTFSFDESSANFEFKELLSSKDETTLPLASSDMDWREYRALLIKQNESQSDDQQINNQQQTKSQEEKKDWAHILRAPEQGCVLVASPYMFTQTQQYFRYVVILIIAHSQYGTMGIILNRPTMYKIKDLEDQTLRHFGLDILHPEFSDNPLMFGGDCGSDGANLFVLHSHGNIEEASEIVKGVYAGGLKNAKDLVSSGELPSQDFKFYTKYCGWRPGQLEQELQRKIWVCVSASPGLILQDQQGIDGQTMWHNFLNHMGHQGKQLSLFIKTVQEFERENEEQDDPLHPSSTVEKNLAEAMENIREKHEEEQDKQSNDKNEQKSDKSQADQGNDDDFKPNLQ